MIFENTHEIKENKTYKNNGYVRKVLSVSDDTLHVKTIGTPVPPKRGKPPATGIIGTRSFKTWLKRDSRVKYNKTQLTI